MDSINNNNCNHKEEEEEEEGGNKRRRRRMKKEAQFDISVTIQYAGISVSGIFSADKACQQNSL